MSIMIVPVLTKWLLLKVGVAGTVGGLLAAQFYVAYRRRELKPPKVDLSGRVCVVTGASDGIGFETAKGLAVQGAHVIIACRDVEKGIRAADYIKKLTKNEKVEVMKLELSSFKDVRDFVDRYKAQKLPLHVLVNNAGIFSEKFALTSDGYEQHFQVNYLSPFLLTNLLLDTIIDSAPSRIVNVSSATHYFVKKIEWDNLNNEKNQNMGVYHWYSVSKLFNILFTNELQSRLAEKRINNVTVNALHPGGLVQTNMVKNNSADFAISKILSFFGFTKTIEQAAYTSRVAASLLQYETQGGLYLDDCVPRPSSKLSTNKEEAKKIMGCVFCYNWDITGDAL